MQALAACASNSVVLAENRSPTAAIHRNPSAIHAHRAERHGDIAVAIHGYRSTVAAQLGHALQDHRIGGIGQRCTAIGHTCGDVMGHYIAQEEFAPAGA